MAEGIVAHDVSSALSTSAMSEFVSVTEAEGNEESEAEGIYEGSKQPKP